MSGQSFDPNQYKADQKAGWSAVAGGWSKWWKLVEEGAQKVSDRLVELAHLAEGHRVLDIATGIGEPAITAARKVGSSGLVVATDQADDMLAVARGRAEQFGLRNLEFKVVDAESLAVEDETFDAVMCRWGLMFLPNLDEALTHVYRGLKPGGRFSGSTWDVPPKVPMVSTLLVVVQKMFNPPAPPPGTPSVFGLADPEVLRAALERAGFVDVHTERMDVFIQYPSPEGFTEFAKDLSLPGVALVANETPEHQEEFWRQVREGASKHLTADGTVRMPNTAICFSALRT